MRIRFFNARLLTMKDDEPIHFGEVWVRDDKIEYVGDKVAEDEIERKNIVFDRAVDVKGNVLMPGFKDAHTHSAMTAFRSFADDLPLQEWLETKIFPIEAVMTEDDIYELTRLAVLEYLTSGITGCFEMYLNPYAIEKVAIDTGMRIVQVSGINKFGPSLEELENRYLKLNGNSPLASFMLGFHAEYTCTKELLSQISDMAHKYRCPIYAHNSETQREVDECIERYNMTPTELMESLNMFDFGGGGYHCVYLSDNDMEIFKKHNLSVVTNPASNLKLASGVAPIKEFLDRGINVAIGTDGPSSNNCLDMFREMFLVTGLAKVKNGDAASVPAGEVLKMATVGGARAMGLDSCDVLDVGKQADMIIIDLNCPNMQPLNNIADNIVYSGCKSNVKMTMVAGKILYEDGKFNIGVEPEQLYEKANTIISRLKGELEK